MPKEQLNELMALPWPELAKQFADRANTQVNCIVSDEASYDSGKKSKTILGVKVSWRVRWKWDSGEFTSSKLSPPGYEHLSRSKFVIAAPLRGTWRAGIKSGFKAKFEGWVGKKKVLSASPQITQRLEVFGLRLRAALRLNTSEPARPRLTSADVAVRLGLRLRGLIDSTWGPETAVLEVDPPDKYVLKIPLDVPLGGTAIDGLMETGFEGHIVFTVHPETTTPSLLPTGPGVLGDALDFVDEELHHVFPRYREIGVSYEGDLKLTLFEAKILGQKFEISTSVPFRFDPGLRIATPGGWWDFLPDPTQIPKSWGEKPPDSLKPLLMPPAGFDFLAPALELESAVMPDSALIEASSGILPPAPYPAPFGLVYEIHFPCGQPPKEKPALVGFEDTAIWSGHFLAAEAFRYAATESGEALDRVRFITRGVEKLFQVTGVDGLFARAALPQEWPYQTNPSMCKPTATTGTKCHPGTLERTYQRNIGDEMWCGYGRGDDPITRDQYIGILLGMACAWRLVDDEEVHDIIRGLVTSALRYLVVQHKWNVRTPVKQPILTSFMHQFVHQLALLRVGKTVNPQEFGAMYDHFSPGADGTWIPIWGTAIEPIQKYYKFNLSHAAMLILLLLEDNRRLRAEYRFAFNILRRATRHHRNAHFNLVRVMTELEPDRDDALAEDSGFSGSLFDLRKETRALLWQWLMRRDCIAGPRNLPEQRPPDPQFMTHLLDEDSVNRAVEYTTVGSHSPVGSLIAKWALPVVKRLGADFVWQKPPFSTGMCLCGGHSPVVSAQRPNDVSPAIDYLLPFWMGQYLQIFDSQATAHAAQKKKRLRSIGDRGSAARTRSRERQSP